MGWVQAEPHASGNRNSDIPAFQLVSSDGFDNRAGELLGIDAELEVHGMGGTVKAGDMVVQPEYAPVIDANSLKRAVAVEEAVVVNIHVGFFAGNQFVVQKDPFRHVARPQVIGGQYTIPRTGRWALGVRVETRRRGDAKNGGIATDERRISIPLDGTKWIVRIE
jgi:hypothetical protein